MNNHFAKPLSRSVAAFVLVLGLSGCATTANNPKDPFEGFNRAMFTVNDRLYFWFLKPVGQGYAAVVPETGRIGVRNFFKNLLFPVRFVNSVLQFKLLGAERELARFVINTGSSLGFADIAYNQPASLPYPTENPFA